MKLNENHERLYNDAKGHLESRQLVQNKILEVLNGMYQEYDSMRLEENEVDPNVWNTLISGTQKIIDDMQIVINNKIKDLIRKTKLEIEKTGYEVEQKPEGLEGLFVEPINYPLSETFIKEGIETIINLLIESNDSEIYTDINKDDITKLMNELLSKYNISSENEELVNIEIIDAMLKDITEEYNEFVAIDIIWNIFVPTEQIVYRSIIDKISYISFYGNEEEVVDTEEETVEGTEDKGTIE